MVPRIAVSARSMDAGSFLTVHGKIKGLVLTDGTVRMVVQEILGKGVKPYISRNKP